jgi:hypothetical protein
VLWIRKDPHHFGNLDPNPHPHQIKIWIRIKIYKLYREPDLDPHQFEDVKPKCMECESILALFQGFQPFFKARIWIGKVGSQSASGSAKLKNKNPDPRPDSHQGDKSNPDPHPSNK